MKKDLTELVFILDRSGSMHGLENDTIGGFNSMLAKQKAVQGEALVTTALFSDEFELLHDRIAIRGVQPITENEYTVGGCTALLDAIGRTVDKITRAHKHTAPTERPGRTVFVITTDGLENASQEYDRNAIKQLINEKQERDSWEFLFLGANIDAISVARDIGIGAARAARFVCDPVGTKTHYSAVAEALELLRANVPLTSAWKASIERDTALRGQSR